MKPTDYSRHKSAYPTAKAIDIGSSSNRILPRQLSTGSTRGTQTVGYGDTKIDGSNNTITVGDSILLDGNNDVISVNTDSSASVTLGSITQPDGSVGAGLVVTNTDGSQTGMGSIPGFPGEWGMFLTDEQGRITMKMVNGNIYWYNPEGTLINYMLAGKKPDNTYGWAVAAPGFNVSQGYS